MRYAAAAPTYLPFGINYDYVCNKIGIILINDIINEYKYS